MNKKAGLYFVFLLGIILAINLVSAQFFYDLKYKTQDAIRIITDFISPFLEFILGVSSFDQYFWVRVLLLALIFVIVLTVLSYIEIFKRNSATRAIVSFVVAVFSAKYIGESDIITGILLPYGALGIALTFILPFVIFFFFVHKAMDSGPGRRLAWGFFAIIFLGLWHGRADQLGSVGWIYSVGIVAVVIAVIFDYQIHDYFKIREMTEERRKYYSKRWAELQKELHDNEVTINKPETPERIKEHLRKRNEEIDKEMKNLYKKI